MDIFSKYFPDLTATQKDQIFSLFPLYQEWNARINVISRKDIDHLNERHILHALSIAKIIQFLPGSRIIDIGTGGGFPGIPLAILFPDSTFHMVDSIGKKIMVVDKIASAINLKNVSTEKNRAESITGQYDFVVSRAVTSLPLFTQWVRHLISKKGFNTLENGILYLKGGELEKELKVLKMKSRVYPLAQEFAEDFFASKSLIHLY